MIPPAPDPTSADAKPGHPRSPGTPLARWGAALTVDRDPGPLSSSRIEADVDLLVRRGLAGLAWTAVVEGRAEVPERMAELLQGAWARQGLRERIALETLEEIRGVFEKAGIESRVYKGVALIETGVYAPGERRLADIDLLVRPDRARRAVEALESAGFRPWVPWREGRTEWLSAFTLDPPTAPPGLNVPIDLHWSTRYADLRSGGHRGPDPLWGEPGEMPDRETTGASRAPGSTPAVGLERHWAAIADHLVKHLRVTTHLAGFTDLVRLLERDPDPGRLLSAVETRGIVPRVRRLMDLLVQRFDLDPARLDPLPDDLLPTGRPVPPALTPEALVLRHGAVEERLAGLRLRWAMGGRPLADLVGVVWPGAEWLRARHPDASGSLAARLLHWREVGAWLVGRGASPLSPNQEFE